MRQILFKAKRVDNGEWVQGYYACKGKDTDLETHVICVSTLSTIENPYFYLTDIEIDPNTLCQYIGLEYKNGVKIFEGDLLKVFLEYEHCNVQTYNYDDYITEATVEVKFGTYNQDGSGDEYLPRQCHGFYAEVIEENKKYFSEYEYCNSILQLENFEVIGNIHDKEKTI